MWVRSRELWKVNSKDHAVTTSTSVQNDDGASCRATPLSGTPLGALRNSMDAQLQVWNPTRVNHSGQGGPYGSNWVEHPALPLLGLLRLSPNPHKWTYTLARHRAHADSDARNPSHPRVGVPPTHDDVVAHITFGIWVHLLPDKRDNSSAGFGPGPQRGLWNHALHAAFPFKPDPLVITIGRPVCTRSGTERRTMNLSSRRTS